MIRICPADPTSDALRPVLEAHVAHSRSAGPAESNHTLEPDELTAPDIRFWVILEDGQVLGCGALKALPDGTAEVKSVHVLPQARGRGVARRMMAHLAEVARSEGFAALVLETGAAHLPDYDAARKLYETLGYGYCGPIFGYHHDPNSAFMRLDLVPRP